MRKISLNEKLVVYFVVIGVVGLLIVSAFAYYNSREALRSRTFDQLTSVRENKKKQVEAFLANRLYEAQIIAASNEIKVLASQIHKVDADKRIASPSHSRTFLYEYLNKSGYYEHMFLCDSGARCWEMAHDGDHLSLFPNKVVSDNWLRFAISADAFSQGATIYDVANNPLSGKPALLVSAPMDDSISKKRLLLEVDLNAISNIMLENNAEEGLGQSGETYLVGKDTLMRSQSRFQPQSIFKTKVSTEGFHQAGKGKSGIAVINDYRGIAVLSAYSPLEIPGLQWVILAEIDVAEAMAALDDMRTNLLVIGLLNLVIIFVFAFFLARRITAPVIRLNDAASKIGSGILNESLPVISNDEIGELTATFNKMVLQLREQKEALAEERKMRLRSMIDGQEKERQRLSRDLHDGLGQSLIAIKLQLENYCNNQQKKDSDLQMIKIKNYFEQTIDDIRRMSNDLAPTVLKEFGLTTALRNLCRNLTSQSGINIRFAHHEFIAKLSPKTEIYLYRIVQEALSNSIKHARASHIGVSLSVKNQIISLLITDDGSGFEIEKVKKCSGNGINNIYERARILDTRIKIDSAPGKGTQIALQLKIEHT